MKSSPVTSLHSSLVHVDTHCKLIWNQINPYKYPIVLCVVLLHTIPRITNLIGGKAKTKGKEMKKILFFFLHENRFFYVFFLYFSLFFKKFFLSRRFCFNEITVNGKKEANKRKQKNRRSRFR